MNIKLPNNVVNDLLNAEYTAQDIAQMSRREVIDAWLIYNGIIGFTTLIMNVCDKTKED
jgi:hypothetical protein